MIYEKRANRGHFFQEPGSRASGTGFAISPAMPIGSSARSHTFVAASRQMLLIRELARRAGRSDAKTLITGETGVGKDVVAREIQARLIGPAASSWQ